MFLTVWLGSKKLDTPCEDLQDLHSFINTTCIRPFLNIGMFKINSN